MSRIAASSVDAQNADWDDPELWSESPVRERFSFGGRSPRDIALSVALLVVPFVLMLVVLSLVGSDAGATGGGG